VQCQSRDGACDHEIGERDVMDSVRKVSRYLGLVKYRNNLSNDVASRGMSSLRRARLSRSAIGLMPIITKDHRGSRSEAHTRCGRSQPCARSPFNAALFHRSCSGWCFLAATICTSQRASKIAARDHNSFMFFVIARERS
jgi:hypothetical protein